MTARNPQRFDRVKSIVIGALELDGAERLQYLDRACASDSSLRNEVDALLATGEPIEGVALSAGFEGAVLDEGGLDDPLPEVLAGRYRIDAYLAEGGMGRVYKAHDLELDVPVALKTIHPRIAAHPFYLRLFKQEVLLARSITHPNVCRIFELGQDEPTGTVFLTMEFLDGETLTARIRSEGSLDTGRSMGLVRDMADALDAAHRAGIVHRDFKSPNVMLVASRGSDSAEGDRAVVTDFGLAVTLEEQDEHSEAPSGGSEATETERVGTDARTVPAREADSDRTTIAAGSPIETRSSAGRESKRIVGTPAYMAPEQVMGERVGPPADLYAFGVVLFEMCTGQLPFSGTTPLEIARARVSAAPPSPKSISAVDDAWDRAIRHLLARDPEDRPATAGDVVFNLEGRDGTATLARSALPPERDVFVGRIEELRALADALERDTDDESALVTLLGVGGTGKSRLAQKYGWDSLLRWPGGVWFCELTEARSIEGVVTAVSAALDVPLQAGDPVAQLGSAIAGLGRCLVVLDNFEQVVAHAETTVRRWMQDAPEARFLVTSRERLRIEGETVMALEPLDPRSGGVELFEARAWGHRPGFVVDASNSKLIVDIVERLDGLPLAIEMAASRMRRLNPGQIERALTDRFRLLASRKTGRHATMQATLDWSWDLLEPWERSAIAQASVFEGGFTLEAAEHVIDLSEEAAPPVLDVIQALVDKSWLRTTVALGAPRFEMYATVQEYAAARLGDVDVHACTGRAVESRHGAFFARMGTNAWLERLDGVDGWAELRLEFENVVAACRRAVGRGDDETATFTYLAAGTMLRQRGPFSFSASLGREVLDVVQQPALRAQVLMAVAASSRFTEGLEESLEHFGAALVLHRELGHRSDEAKALGHMGTIHRVQGRLDEAQTHFEVGQAVFRETGDRRGEAVALGNLGNVHLDRGATEDAIEAYGRALLLAGEVGDQNTAGMMHANLGIVLMGRGRMVEALEHYESGLAIYRSVGYRIGEGMALGNMGILFNSTGEVRKSFEHFEQALATHREVGNRRDEGIVLGNLAALYLDVEQLTEAEEHFGAALVIHRDIRNRRFEGIELAGLAVAHMGQGRLESARACFDDSLAILGEVGDLLYEAIAVGGLGRLHAMQGRREEGRRCLERSVATLRDLDERLELARMLCDLGEFELQSGEAAAARAALAESEAIEKELSLGPISFLARKIEALRRGLESRGSV